MSLESLHLELKVMVMSKVQDLKTVHNIVHASPDYYQAYLGAREDILHSLTVRTLYESNVSTLDVWTTVNAPQLGLDAPHRKEMITEYLQRYGDGLTNGYPRFTVNESLEALRLHHKIKTLVEGYCDQKLNVNPRTGKRHEMLRVSSSELRRLFRAFYRFELYCRIFAINPETTSYTLGCAEDGTNINGEPPRYPPSNGFDEGYVAELFFGLFPIHEVEALACLYKYMQKFFDELVRLETRRESGFWFWIEILVAQGPSVVYRPYTISSPGERKHSVEFDQIKTYVHSAPDITWRDALDAYERVLYRGVWPWRGMNDLTGSESLPPAGWVMASKRGIANVDLRLRRLGYVFWDERRFQDWGITEETMLDWPWRNESIHVAGSDGSCMECSLVERIFSGRDS